MQYTHHISSVLSHLLQGLTCLHPQSILLHQSSSSSWLFLQVYILLWRTLCSLSLTICDARITLMNHIFANMIAEKWLKIYMDDIDIHTKDNLTLHHERTRCVLLWLWEHGLSLKISKYIFDAPRMEFLEMIIEQGKVEMDPKKLDAIQSWKPPTSVKAIQSFTGFANFYQKFIPNFSNIITPLNLLTQKNEPWVWMWLQQNAFETLKQIFSSTPVLLIPNVTCPFTIMTDAFLLAAGAVLMQTDDSGDHHPCAYFSKTFASAKWNYDIYDRELLAVILALDEWWQYLWGTTHPVTIITNHRNLSYIKDPRKLSHQQACWFLFLQDFDIRWQITPGTQMVPADTLSQKDLINTADDNADVTIIPDPVVIQALDLFLARHIKSSSSSNPLVLKVIQAMQDGSPLFPCSALVDWTFKNGCLYFKEQMYIPPAAHCSLVCSLHESPTSRDAGHFRTKAIIEHDFWWPGLSSFVNAFVSGCATCQQNKVNHHPICPPLSPIPSSSSLPFRQLSIDLITNLPPSAGHDSLMVMVDHGLTKGVILTPCSKNINAAGIAQLFLSHVFKHFSLHDSLISDRGLQFASAFAWELAWLLHYDVHLSTTYHSQTDGQTEQANQEIETYLWIFCANNPQKWTELLTTAEFYHNSSPHSYTKTSPFSLMLGYELCSYPPLRKTFLPALENHLSSLEEARKEALVAHKSACQIMTKCSSWRFTPWKVGDKVWLEATHLRLHYPSKKLAPKRHSPFEITQVLSPLTDRLCLPPTWKVHDVFHATLLSPYQETNVHGSNFSRPPPNIIDAEEEYEIDQIIAHCGNSKNHQYLTTWKGYLSSENTWECESNLWHAPYQNC